jgi:superfamily II DNA or RNA helicase
MQETTWKENAREPVKYAEFLESKHITAVSSGFDPKELNHLLFPFQRDIVRFALRRGRAAIFADCGLGKTPMQLEWAQRVVEHTNRPVLALAPLAVSRQTQREGDKFGVEVTVCRSQADVRKGVNIANYEMLEHFDCSTFGGVVLDESSILKSYSGKIRNQIIEAFSSTPYKLACTATPAPNDYMELGNHSEFLNVMSRTEMLSMFFVHDGGETSEWRLKGHAEDKYWEWVASWACVIKKPSDLGYSDEGFNLQELRIHEHVLSSETAPFALIPMMAETLTERREARRASLDDRVERAAELANGTGQWLVWCDFNLESERLTASINEAVEVKGADDQRHKETAMLGFAAGDVRALVTKPSIAGFGMNWQNCHQMIFCGLSDSYEQFYQAVRRCWRFGQKDPVDVHVIISEAEGRVLQNIKRKETDADNMAQNMVQHTAKILTAEIQGTTWQKTEYRPTQVMRLPGWIGENK